MAADERRPGSRESAATGSSGLRVSIVIPTRGRPDYLETTLATVVPQARAEGADVVVVPDGPDPESTEVATRHGVRAAPLPRPRGANAARNHGVAVTAGALVVLCDDDIRACPGWLGALLSAADAAPDHDVFGGPILARLEGGGPRACGREPAPVTTLDLGPEDRDVTFVWSANMAIRRRALENVGPFDETIHGRGEEEEWQRRLAAGGGRIRYVAGARIEHRRTPRDSRLRALARAQYALGRTARRWDARKGAPPPAGIEARVLAGCVWHIARRRCAIGVVMAAHSAGRVREMLAGTGRPSARHDGATGAGARGRPAAAAPVLLDDAPRDFLSGTSGQVWGIRATTRATVADAAADLRAAATLRGPRLARAAAAAAPRRILALGIEREDAPNLLAAAVAELHRSHHEVEFAGTTTGGRGKFENLNRLLAAHPPDGFDWLLILDDDVALPQGFLDGLIFLAERFGLRMAQPAHRYRSHAAWQVTRRRANAVVRETAFVEIGPVVALQRETFPALLPFPPLRYGWGLDAAWSAIAREHGWPIGVVDAVAVRHGLRRIAAAYDREDAVAEGQRFLAGRPYTRAAEARRTLVTHRAWR